MTVADSFRRDPRIAIASVVAVLLVLLMVPPLWILIQDSLTTTNAAGDIDGWTFAHFRKLTIEKHALQSLANSLIFAAGSTILSLLTGGVLAWLVERTNAPCKILAYLAAVISMATPYVLYVLSAEQHSIWLTEQLSKWHRQALESREREMQLHNTNQELRMLAQDELDQPENRRRVESQSAAEGLGRSQSH